MRPTIVITEATTSSDFVDLRTDWNRLVESLQQPTPFLTWEWMWHWWRCLGRREELAILLAWENHDLVAVAPFSRLTAIPPLGPCRLRFLGSGVTDELDFIGSQTSQEGIVERFLTESYARWRWNLLDLQEFSGTSPSIPAVERWAENFLRRSCLSRSVDGLEVSLPLRHEVFWSGLSSRMRAKIRKAEERTLERFSDVSLHVATDPSEVGRAMKGYLDIQTARWSSESWSLYRKPDYRRFLKETATALAGTGYTRIFQLLGDGEILGSYLCFQARKKTFGYGIAVETGFWDLEIGFQLIHRVIQAEIERGQELLDFLRGNEQYKSRFGAEPKRGTRLRVVSPGLRGRLAAVFP